MDSADTSGDRSNTSIITKYDDALINLANARCGYKNSIVKYLARITDAEVTKLKKMTYKEIDPSFPEVIIRKLDPQSNQISKDYQSTAALPEEVVKHSKSLKNDIIMLKEITQKLEQEKKNTPEMF